MFFLRYIGALIYDLLTLIVILLALTAGILLCHQDKAIAPGTWWYQMMLWIGGFAYYYYSLKLGGQTLGMRAWRFKLVSLTGTPLSLSQILKRLGYAIPALLLMPLQQNRGHQLNQWTQTAFVLTNDG